MSSLAHFREAVSRRDLVQELVDAGLAGLEVYYRSFDLPTTEAMEQLAASMRLLATGGSDYHGDTGTYAESPARLGVPPQAGDRPLDVSQARDDFSVALAGRRQLRLNPLQVLEHAVVWFGDSRGRGRRVTARAEGMWMGRRAGLPGDQ